MRFLTEYRDGKFYLGHLLGSFKVNDTATPSRAKCIAECIADTAFLLGKAELAIPVSTKLLA